MNHSQYLYDIAVKINNIYSVTEESKNEKIPEIITKLYDHTQRYQNEVKNLKNRNLMKRIWYLNRDNDKYVAVL